MYFLIKYLIQVSSRMPWVRDICSITQKGSIENVENYRGITLLSVIGKLFTNILNTRLNDWAENYRVYVETQAGFRKGMGTMDNIFVMHSLISYCINTNKNYIQHLLILKRLLILLLGMCFGLN